MPQGARRIAWFLLAACIVATPPAMARAAGAVSYKTLAPGKLKVCLYAEFRALLPGRTKQANGTGGTSTIWRRSRGRISSSSKWSRRTSDGIWLAPGNGDCDVAGTGISDTEERRKATDGTGTWSNTYYQVVRTFLVWTEQFTNLSGIGDSERQDGHPHQGLDGQFRYLLPDGGEQSPSVREARRRPALQVQGARHESRATGASQAVFEHRVSAEQRREERGRGRRQRQRLFSLCLRRRIRQHPGAGLATGGKRKALPPSGHIATWRATGMPTPNLSLS